MKKTAPKIKTFKVAKGNQKITSFFNLQSSKTTSAATHSVTNVSSDEDIIPATPVVINQKKPARNKKILKPITNIETNKRKYSDSDTDNINVENVDIVKKKCLSLKQKNELQNIDSTNKILIKTPDKLIQGIGSSSDKLKTPEKLHIGNNGFINGSTPYKTPNNVINNSPKINTPSPKLNKSTPSKTKSPRKLFMKSPNISDFQVEVLENFIKITPSKSNKITIKTPTKSSEKIQRSLMQYASTSIKSVSVQKENENTPEKTISSSSSSCKKLNFSTIVNFENSFDDVKFLNESWDDLPFLSPDVYTLDLTTTQRCKVIEITRDSIVWLKIESVKSKEKALCQLEGFWVNSVIEVGCTIHILAVKNGTNWKVTNTDGLFVYEPDILISTTSVVGALFCKRRGVLKERFSGFESENKVMVVGILVHQLLQTVLKTKMSSPSEIKELLTTILSTNETIRMMYASSLTLDELKNNLFEFIPRIATFMKHYVDDKKTVINGDEWKGSIDSIQDIEENIWCPELGIKGKVDVTIKFDNKILPLELKTGKASMSLEHRGQVMLYIMMMSKLGYETSSGLLLYLRDGVLREINNNEREKRDLILLRNELTYYLTRKSQIKLTNLETPELPDPINHHSACQKCPYNIICCSYLSYDKVDLSNNGNLRAVRDEALGHLDESHLRYFIHWSNLLDLECSEKKGKDLRFIYTQTPQEREKYGKCIMNVKVKCVEECDGLFNHIFEKLDDLVNLLTCGIGESNYVVVSIDKRPAVSAGIVNNIDHKSITVALDKDLSIKYPNYTFHLDTYDSGSAHSFNFTNLALLLEPTTKSDRLRKLIIAKETPTFVTKLPKAVARKAIPIFRTLNKTQQRAVLRVLSANDYVLIKGMPGTGKTATIVALIRLLVELDQTILITSHTHLAVDNVCLRLKEFGIGVLRLGAEGRIHPGIQSMSESALTKNCKSPEELEQVYNTAKILAVTCLGSKHPVLNKRVMDVCIVDESTQVLQCSVFRALSASKKFVLIGDPDQLPPIVKNREAQIRGLSESLFERLQSDEGTVTLNLNYRMNKTITALSNHLTYEGQLLIGNDDVANAVFKPRNNDAFISTYKNYQWIIDVFDSGLSSSVKILNTGPVWNRVVDMKISKKIDTFEFDEISCTNPYETAIILNLIDALIKAETPTKSIGIMAPYRAQVALISSLLRYKDIDISTVDQFQGQDKDVIIYSSTKSKNVLNVKAFDILEDKRRLTVALTRAKCKFILVCDVTTIKSYTPFAKLLTGIDSDNYINLKDGELDFNWEKIITCLDQ